MSEGYANREAALDRINDDPAWAQRAYGAPPAVLLAWCPVCGVVSQTLDLLHHARYCSGDPIRVKYEPVRQQPLRSAALGQDRLREGE